MDENNNVNDLESSSSCEELKEVPSPGDSPESLSETTQVPAPQNESGDYYGVEEPAPRVYPAGRAVEMDSEDPPASEQTDVSMETIYSRRKAAERQSEAGQKIEIPEPIPLPAHPFLTRLLRPLVNPGMLLKLGCLASVLWGLLLISVPLFQRSTRNMFKEGMQPGVSVVVDLKAPGGMIRKNVDVTADELTARLSSAERFFLGKKSGILFGAWRRFGYLFLFAFIPWGFCAIPFLLQIVEQTSDGDDKIAMWPDLSLLPMIGRFAWFLLLSATAGIPGYLLLGTVGLARLGFVISFLLVFPVFYLSTAGTDSFFCLLSKNVLRGIKLASAAWRNWFFISFVLTFSAFFLFFLVTGDGVFHLRSGVHLLLLTLVCALFLTLCAFLFFRILGRLAWVMRDRLQSEDAQATEDIAL